MRHVFITPKQTFYSAPANSTEANGEKKQFQVWLINENGRTKYEFWLEEENAECYFLSRTFDNGSKYIVEVLKERVTLEDFRKKKRKRLK